MAHDLFTWDIDERYRDPNPHQFRRVTDADLAALGYVKRPTCDMCYGTGTHPNLEQPNFEHVPCPKCGGSGYGRLVSLDVDVEALRRAVKDRQDLFDLGHMDYLGFTNPIWRTARQVLAALDGEET